MPNKMEVTCFTDLKGSTSLTETLGNEEYAKEIVEHIRVAKSLTSRLGGIYVKNIGDAHMVRFEYLEAALRFALQLQEYYRPQPAIERRSLQLRVGMYLGVIEPSSNDVFGSGVNQAARVEGKADIGEIIINRDLVQALQRVWGNPKTAGYFVSIGEQELKGISDPPKQELFSFVWEQYGHDFPEEGLTGIVYEQLKQARVEASLLTVTDLSKPGIIIWPVVPRDLATAIHRGQTEIVRILALLGWRIKLLIADCGARNNYDRRYSESFCEKLKAYLTFRDTKIEETFFLSDFFEPSYAEYQQVQALFRKIASDLTLQDLLNINNKEYADDVKAEIRQSATLDCLRPALSLAAVLFLIQKQSQKGIVLSGADEKIQWERAYELDIPDIRTQIGALMNPVLKADATHQSRQKRAWPSWSSQEALIRAMEPGNLAWWTYNLHAYIPVFPERGVAIGDQYILTTDWTDELTIPSALTKEALAEYVWPKLNPAI